MQNKNQSGNVIFNILLIVLLVVIAVLIYMLVGSNRAKIGDTVGIESPTYQTVSQPAERDDIFQMVWEPHNNRNSFNWMNLVLVLPNAIHFHAT